MRGGRRFSCGDEALDIFCKYVGFDVDGVVDRHRADVGVPISEGDDGDVRDTVVCFPTRDGEADAVDGDRAFFGDVLAQILRDADGEPPVVAFGNETRDAADSVDVALHEMAAEPRGGGERALEVDGLAGLLFAEGGAPERFAGKIGGEGAG